MPRLEVQKTYKLFIDGKFPRTESGHYYPVKNESGKLVANVCLASRKDFKSAVVAARKAQPSWQEKTAYNKAQILYRLAEIIETRKQSFTEEMKELGLSKKAAQKEVEGAIDRLVYYAGWCDKYTALFSSVNPVASSHFNFSVHEPTGVVAIVAPESSPLLGLVSSCAPVLAGGNTVVALASENMPTSSITLAEAIQNSDIPGGVVNILTGNARDLLPHITSHMDVNALVVAREESDEKTLLAVTGNVKRFVNWAGSWDRQDPYMILALQELKTTWHPVQVNTGGGGGY